MQKQEIQTNVVGTEVVLSRWAKKFGTEDHSRYDFIDYLSERFMKVRGERVEICNGERKPASDKFLRQLVEESEYWEHKEQVKDACEDVDSKARKADDYTYVPVDLQTIQNADATQVLFNTYKSPELGKTAATEAELKLWNDYWAYLLPEESERMRVQQWSASLAFRPEQRTGVALLLHGESTGTGKSTLGEVLTELVGTSNTTKPANAMQALVGRFNGALQGKVLFSVDELYAGEGFALANGIKAKVTEPSLYVELKGKEMHRIDNYCNFFATSNELSPLWLDDKDRRWEVYSVEYDAELKSAHQLAIKAFREWFEGDKKHAVSVIRSLLKAVDIAEYKPWREGAKMTEAKRKLISNSVSSTENDFELHWNQQEFNDDMVINATKSFKEWRSISGGKRAGILTRLGCKKLDSTGSVKIGKDQCRQWWITPKGLSVGMKSYMNGKEIGEILKEHRSDVTGATYDDSSESLTVITRTRFG